MGVSPQGIETRVRALAEEVTARAGYDLVDVEYRREPGGWTLRLFIDKSGGVTLADCQRVSEEFGTILEVEDPIPNRFNLEVSSPGLDRPLRKDKDFYAARDQLVRIMTREPLRGQRNFTGRLVWIGPSGPQGETEGDLESPAESGDSASLVLRVVDDSGNQHEIPAGVVERARIVPEWPEKRKAQRGPKNRRNGNGSESSEKRAGRKT